MKNTFKLILAVLVICAGTRCASIVSKSSYPVTFNSTPTTADISITDRKGNIVFNGTTPTTVKLKSGSGYFSRAKYSIKYSKEGYDDLIFPLEADLDGWYFGNFGFGGLIGFLIVDPATGAMYKISSPVVMMSLKQATTSNNDALHIQDINDVPDRWKPHLEKIN